jgi:hypothetical protein
MPIRVINESPDTIKFKLEYFKGFVTKVDVSLGVKAGPLGIRPGVAVEQEYKEYKPGTWMTLKAKRGIAKVSQRFGLIHRGKTTVTIRSDRTGQELALTVGFGWIRIRPEENGIQEVWTKSFSVVSWSKALQLDSPLADSGTALTPGCLCVPSPVFPMVGHN